MRSLMWPRIISGTQNVCSSDCLIKKETNDSPFTYKYPSCDIKHRLFSLQYAVYSLRIINFKNTKYKL